MNRCVRALLSVPVAAALAYVPGASADAAAKARPFEAADLKVEINATDGDAGLQVFLDAGAWRRVKLVNPAGQVLLDVRAKGLLGKFGLTELFAESNEPPFEEFPLAQFRRLFPAGNYVFTGRLTDGTKLRSVVPLTHHFPAGPKILQPQDGAQLARDQVVIRWSPGQPTADVRVVGYQVVVEREDGTRVLSVDLPAGARFFRVPATFFQHGTAYKVEVLAIETSGNQTLTAAEFEVR